MLNGKELGGGSVRIHRSDVQATVFKALGLSEEEAREKFGFFLDRLTTERLRTAASRWAWIVW